MTVTVISIPATLTIDANQAFTMQGMFNTVYSQLPSGQQYTVTGISFPQLGMTCSTSGIIDPIADIKNAIARLYNYVMKAYLEPIWNLLNDLLRALENVVGNLLNVNLDLPILGLKISDLFSDNLWNLLTTAVTNLYHTAIDDLKALLSLLGIPFDFNTSTQSVQLDIQQIVKNIFNSLWSVFLQAVKGIIDAIQAGLALYDAITSPQTFPPPLSTIFKTAFDAILSAIIDLIATGGPTVQAIYDLIVSACKAALNKAEVTLEEILNWLENFTIPIFGKPFDWAFPFNIHINSPWKDFTQILGDIKLYCTNFLGLILAEFVKAIDAILSVFGLSLSFPILKISYTVCATLNE
jgi:hypothetical protein